MSCILTSWQYALTLMCRWHEYWQIDQFWKIDKLDSASYMYSMFREIHEKRNNWPRYCKLILNLLLFWQYRVHILTILGPLLPHQTPKRPSLIPGWVQAWIHLWNWLQKKWNADLKGGREKWGCWSALHYIFSKFLSLDIILWLANCSLYAVLVLWNGLNLMSNPVIALALWCPSIIFWVTPAHPTEHK